MAKVNPSSGEVVEDDPSAELAPLEYRVPATPMSFEEALAAAAQYGSADAVIIDPYEKVNKDKDLLVDRPFFIQRVKFMTDRATGNEYVNLWVIRDDNRMLRVTDGSTGIFKQISELVQNRLDTNHKTPYHNFLLPNGLAKSEFLVDEETKQTYTIGDPDNPKTGLTKAATYYFA